MLLCLGSRDHEKVGERGVLEVHPVSPPPALRGLSCHSQTSPVPLVGGGFQEDRGPGQSREQEEEG